MVLGGVGDEVGDDPVGLGEEGEVGGDPIEGGVGSDPVEREVVTTLDVGVSVARPVPLGWQAILKPRSVREPSDDI